MSKLILLLSIVVLIGLYAGVVEGCKGGWCHPYQGYGCCAHHQCSSYFMQGGCLTDAEVDELRPLWEMRK